MYGIERFHNKHIDEGMVIKYNSIINFIKIEILLKRNNQSMIVNFFTTKIKSTFFF